MITTSSLDSSAKLMSFVRWKAGKDLSKLTAEDIMFHDRIAVTAETTIEAAVKIMEEKRLLNLPVKQNGKVAYSVTRHDLLRAWIGLGTTGED